MSQTSLQQNRFERNREVQEEFVNGIAKSMLSLAETAGEWEKGWSNPIEMPFCPVTGKEYSGANMIRLQLISIEKGYEDNRWLTFRQLQAFQKEHPDLKMNIRKGEQGVKLLRPEEIAFTIENDGRWKFFTPEQATQIENLKSQGKGGPEIQRKTLLYPFTVFNAEQITGFPLKEHPAPARTEIERNELLERFIACSGVAVEHSKGVPHFNHKTDTVSLPYPDFFHSTDDYYAAKLREFFTATGHETRDARQPRTQTLKDCAIEEMRAEMFSLLAGAHLNLPMPENNSAALLKHWNQKFSDGDARAVFRAASEAARVLATLRQFEAGEQPAAQWFPKREAWPELVEMQKQRDAAQGVSFREGAFSGAPHPTPARSASRSLAESVNAFEEADDPVTKARLILQNPDFLNMALKHDPDSVMELASLCEQVSQVLHMEMDDKLRFAPGAVEISAPLLEQQAASAQRMRI